MANLEKLGKDQHEDNVKRFFHMVACVRDSFNKKKLPKYESVETVRKVIITHLKGYKSNAKNWPDGDYTFAFEGDKDFDYEGYAWQVYVLFQDVKSKFIGAFDLEKTSKYWRCTFCNSMFKPVYDGNVKYKKPRPKKEWEKQIYKSKLIRLPRTSNQVTYINSTRSMNTCLTGTGLSIWLS